MMWLLIAAGVYFAGFYLPMEVGVPITVVGILITLWRCAKWEGFGRTR